MTDSFYMDLMKKLNGLQEQINALRTIEIGGVWQNYTPTITAGSGSLTTVSATGFYSVIGKVVQIIIDITITTNGTGAGYVVATLPFTVNRRTILSGRDSGVTGDMLQGETTSGNANVLILNYDNAYPGGDGRVLHLSGFISIA